MLTSTRGSPFVRRTEDRAGQLDRCAAESDPSFTGAGRRGQVEDDDDKDKLDRSFHGQAVREMDRGGL